MSADLKAALVALLRDNTGISQARANTLVSVMLAHVALDAKKAAKWKKKRMASVPHPNEQGMRIVGFVIPNGPGMALPSEHLAQIISGQTEMNSTTN